MGGNLRSITVEATGQVVPDASIGRENARLCAIYGAATVTGRLILRDGDATGRIVLDLPIAAGGVEVEPPCGIWQFQQGMHAEFSGGLEGAFALTLA